MVNKKTKAHLFRIIGSQKQQQVSYSDGSLFSVSVLAILVLMQLKEIVLRHIPVKNKNISKKTNNKQIRSYKRCPFFKEK